MRRVSKRLPWRSPFYWRYNRSPALKIEEQIGTIALCWNNIESLFNYAFDVTLWLPRPVTVEVRSRISGLTAKLEIIKAFIALEGFFLQGERNILSETIGHFDRYRKARDAVIHVRPQSRHVRYGDAAQTFERNGQVYEVLLSNAALETLIQHLDAYQEEMAIIGDVVSERRQEIASRDSKSPPVREFAKQVQELLHSLRDHQAKRKSLPPLPEFPEEDQGAAKT